MNDLPKENRYAVMDARASVDLDAAAIFAIGSASQCCAYANSGRYGSDVLVVDLNQNEVCWQWIATGRWRIPSADTAEKPEGRA